MKDIFPIFIVTAILGLLAWMALAGFPFGIILTVALLGIGFGVAELERKLRTGRSVSQEFWRWSTKTEQDSASKYLFCPACNQGFKFPNKWKAHSFGVLFIMTIVIITVGHLLWK